MFDTLNSIWISEQSFPSDIFSKDVRHGNKLDLDFHYMSLQRCAHSKIPDVPESWSQVWDWRQAAGAARWDGRQNLILIHHGRVDRVDGAPGEHTKTAHNYFINIPRTRNGQKFLVIRNFSICTAIINKSSHAVEASRRTQQAQWKRISLKTTNYPARDRHAWRWFWSQLWSPFSLNSACQAGALGRCAPTLRCHLLRWCRRNERRSLRVQSSTRFNPSFPSSLQQSKRVCRTQYRSVRFRQYFYNQLESDRLR